MKTIILKEPGAASGGSRHKADRDTAAVKQQEIMKNLPQNRIKKKKKGQKGKKQSFDDNDSETLEGKDSKSKETAKLKVDTYSGSDDDGDDFQKLSKKAKGEAQKSNEKRAGSDGHEDSMRAEERSQVRSAGRAAMSQEGFCRLEKERDTWKV